MSTVCCPLCGVKNAKEIAHAHDYEYLSCDDVFTYFECNSCACVFLNDAPVHRLDEIYPQDYYSNSAESSHSAFLDFLISLKEKMDARLFSKVLADIPGQSLSVLDVGGGSGWLSDIIRKADRRVSKTTVVDLNESSRKEAESRGHVFICDKIENFETDQPFDLIVMLNLIEHVENPRLVLLKMRELIGARGRIIIKTPNTDTWDRKLFKHLYWGGYHCPRHWVLFNKKNFIQLARDCELRLNAFFYTQGAPQWTGSLIGSWNSHLWKKNGRSNLKKMHEFRLLAPLSLFFALFDFLRLPFFPTAQMILVLDKE
jgi:2-polyprenyl-3-methyl-5-hydroxy-6-metoxy-1,4-benzoquinol methylase